MSGYQSFALTLAHPVGRSTDEVHIYTEPPVSQSLRCELHSLENAPRIRSEAVERGWKLAKDLKLALNITAIWRLRDWLRRRRWRAVRDTQRRRTYSISGDSTASLVGGVLTSEALPAPVGTFGDIQRGVRANCCGPRSLLAPATTRSVLERVTPACSADPLVPNGCPIFWKTLIW